jgi:uncharacterized protein DUF4038/collagenase-like protein with putative collagen-binding domain
MAGIASTDPNHLQSIELNFPVSYSSQDTYLLPGDGGLGVLTLNAAYTYYETYDDVRTAYASLPTMPVFMTEANYEYESNNNAFPTTNAFILREQEYWTMTSGATGQLYGNHYTWTLSGPLGDSNWVNFLDSPGTLELPYLTSLFSSVPWWKLVPDTAHTVVTSGYGSPNPTNYNLPAANYVTTAWIPDGSLAIIYDVAGAALTVNLGAFSGSVTAQWYDPSSGSYSSIGQFTNSGSHLFGTPGANHDGDKDWVLLLQVLP